MDRASREAFWGPLRVLYRVILWIVACTGAVFCCGNLASRSFAKTKKDKMHVGEQHICAHCDFDVCAFSAICEFITAKKNENVTLVRQKSVVMA